jgi:glutamate formiminotransferase/glutamate formiminotransferase/formiminotetrahydrofolate cyclodeaminase
MGALTLLAVPNVSEGREQHTIAAIADAFAAHGRGRLLDIHSDADHHRSVFTLAGSQSELGEALLAGVRVAVERIDVGEGRDPADIGEHPHVGAVDVMPIVYLDPAQRGAACAQALVVAHEIGEQLGVPVLLYGDLAGGRTRAELRRGGMGALAARLRSGELQSDFGPSRLHPTAGATLVAAREPLVAFNLELAPPATVEDAKRIAITIRDGGAEGLPGLRAIGVALQPGERGGGEPNQGDSRAHTRSKASSGRARESLIKDITIPQVSMNVERPLELPLGQVVEAVRRHAEVTCGELVGLAPMAALVGFPEDVPLRGFDAGVHVIENALGF